MTVFSPDDLDIVKGGPGIRRDLLDNLLVTLHVKNEAARDEFSRVLRQRNALLRQLHGRLDDASAVTLDVWDQRFAESGERLAGLRRRVTEQLRPHVIEGYVAVAGRVLDVGLEYRSDWAARGLIAALTESRADDVRRGISLVGPHRDELVLSLSGLPARTHASQGEQRSLVLALRLGSHSLAIEATGHTPVLVLDDVFSELDERRSAALLGSLPAGQTILTSASGMPSGVSPDQVLEVPRPDAGSTVAESG